MSGFSTIGFDALSEATGGSQASSATWAHTIADRANRLLVVGVSISQSNGSITGVTFNGVSMTKAIGKVLVSGNNYETAIYYLINPPAGTYNIVASFSTSSYHTAGAGSFYNVNQASPLDNTTSTSAGTGTPSANLTVVENALIIDALIHAQAEESSQGAGQSLLYVDTTGSSDHGGESYKIATSSGSYNMTWDAGGQNGYAYALASFKPTVLAGGIFLQNFIR